MKNKELKELIKRIIKTYIMKNMAFTSVDICNYLRSEYPNKDIRMSSVSNLIRKHVLNVSCALTGMYQATYITVDSEVRSGSQIRTYLYHHIDFNPDNYMSRDQVTIKGSVN